MSSKRRSSTWRGTDAQVQTVKYTFTPQTKVLQRELCGFRKLGSLKVQNEETSKSLTSKDVSLQRAEKQLEEKTLECSVLSRQLQNTLDDAQRQVDAHAFTVLHGSPSLTRARSSRRWKPTCRRSWPRRGRLSPKRWTCRAS